MSHKRFITLIIKKLNTAAEPKAKNAVGGYARVSVCVCIVVAINGNTQKIEKFWDSCSGGGKSVVPWRKRQGAGS